MLIDVLAAWSEKGLLVHAKWGFAHASQGATGPQKNGWAPQVQGQGMPGGAP